jgi:hypothetical protein
MSYLSETLAAIDGRRNNIICTCKYVSDSDEVIEGLFADHRIRFSQPWALNDPLEVNPGLVLSFWDDVTNYTHCIYEDVWLPSYRDQVYLNLVEARYNRYGILSLSKQLFSYDMWNRYANAHKGFIVDFKQAIDEHKCFKSDGLFSGLVNYVEKYEIVVDRPIGDNGYATYDYLTKDLFLNKTKHWKDEQEYRIVRPLSEHPDCVEPPERKSYRDNGLYLFDYDPSSISCIIFGAAMDGKKKRRIVELTEHLGIGYFQCLIDKSDDYALYYLPIDWWKDRKQFYSLRPQLLITDGSEFEHRELKRVIRNLDEVPYCRDQRTRQSLQDYVGRIKSRKRSGT